MKRLILILSVYLCCLSAMSQQVAETQKGKRVLIVNASKNDDAQKVDKELVEQLNEWSYWEVATQKGQEDFILELDVSTSTGITATSWGGTSYQLVGKILDKSGSVLWESSRYKASPNGMNGFNAGRSVVKKLVKDLKKKYK